MLHNGLFRELSEAKQNGATPEQLSAILGKGKAKKGMFEGDLEKGELEIGQISALLKTILPASEIVSDIVQSYRTAGGNKLGARFKF